MSTQLFKGGEEVYVKASRVQSYLANGYSTEPADTAAPAPAEKTGYAGMKTPELKALLAAHQIDIPGGIKKPELVALAEKELGNAPDSGE